MVGFPIPLVNQINPPETTGTYNSLVNQIDTLFQTNNIGQQPTFNVANLTATSLTTANVAVQVCILVELRVQNYLMQMTMADKTDLDQIRADELNNIIPSV